MIETRTTEDEIVKVFRDRFLPEGCDGVFLPSVSHLGLRLPVERIVRSLESSGQVRFVVIDGAKDFCHVSADLRNEYCDLYLAGSHKWLQDHHAMGLGIYGRRSSRGMIETVLAHLLSAGELDDPLLRFSALLEKGNLIWMFSSSSSGGSTSSTNSRRKPSDPGKGPTTSPGRAAKTASATSGGRA